jgi:hypothetical protein
MFFLAFFQRLKSKNLLLILIIVRIFNQLDLKIIFIAILQLFLELDSNHEVLINPQGIIVGENIMVVDMLIFEIDWNHEL